jgi:hypothetical protein
MRERFLRILGSLFGAPERASKTIVSQVTNSHERKLPAAVAIVSAFGACLFVQTAMTDSQQNSRSTEKIVNGEFVGMEEIKNYEPGQKWFHENSLLIRDNEAILDKVPLHIVKGKKQYSASDGGFITYRGHFFGRDAQVFIALRAFDSDYIIFPIGGCEPLVRSLPSPWMLRVVTSKSMVFFIEPPHSRSKKGSNSRKGCRMNLWNTQAHDRTAWNMSVRPARSDSLTIKRSLTGSANCQ